MIPDKYPVIAFEGATRFEFLSEGPKGTIKKIVRYQKINEFLFNLAFGDWDEDKQTLSDRIRSNNDDRDKVLATVASTVIEFLHFNPEATVLARGSTPARTRLYQIGVKANLMEMSKLFIVEDYFNGNWEVIQEGKNYDAFSIAFR